MGRHLLFRKSDFKANAPISLPLFTSQGETAESLRRTIFSAIDNYNYCSNLQNLAILTKLSAADRALIRFIVTKPYVLLQGN